MSDDGGTGAPGRAARDRWLGVEVRHLQALAAIAREESFREAADALGYVQSAVSQQIAQLERLVGARLIERSRGSAHVALTEAGVLLLEHAEDILDRYARAHEELATLSDDASVHVRVGVLCGVARQLLPRIRARLAEEGAPAFLEASEHAPDELLGALAEDRLELVICELPIAEQRVAHTRLLDEPVLALVAHDSPLAARRTALAPADLDGLPLIVYRHWSGQQRVLDWLHAQGVAPQVVSSCDDDATAQALVAAGLGIALAPRLAVDPGYAGTALVAVRDAPRRTLALAWRRDREQTPATQTVRVAVLSAARELAAELAAPDAVA